MPDEFREDGGNARTWIGVGFAAATIGAAFVWGRKMRRDEDEEIISDAPPHVLRGEAATEQQGEKTFVGKTVTIGLPRQQLYDTWKDFTRFPNFMENVRAVEVLGGGRSRWLIEGPAGSEVEIFSRIVEDVPGKRIAWESEEGSSIDATGVVEFEEAPAERGTYVRFLMAYDPPGGAIGRGIAKLLQREPTVQARRDLRRFKQLMETGEVSVNASPSARKSENPTEARI
jgi:uncharacterized membrane protein